MRYPLNRKQSMALGIFGIYVALSTLYISHRIGVLGTVGVVYVAVPYGLLMGGLLGTAMLRWLSD